nr:uncharacterized protein c2f12.12c [Quercus suber]
MSRSSIPAKRPAEAQEAAWVADEDRFVLRQAKRKAAMRVKGGRAQPIDWLTVTLVVIDPEHNQLDDELDDGDLEVMEPESVFERLDDAQMAELEKGIDTYVLLEHSRSNLEYWNVCRDFPSAHKFRATSVMLITNTVASQMMKAICQDRKQPLNSTQPSARGVSSITGDLDKLLGPKNLLELEKLEKQIKTKLASNGPMDRDYWEHLLSSLLTYKAKARLRKVSQSILESRLAGLRKQQAADASALMVRLIHHPLEIGPDTGEQGTPSALDGNSYPLDPELLLRLRPEDKLLEAFDDKMFLQFLGDERRKIVKQGYVPIQKRTADLLNSGREPAAKRPRTGGEDINQSTTSASAFDREVARGLSENEEVFTTEEDVITNNKAQWSGTYRPRKPKHFNRVHTGYEWNKYNQTHYDHDNPPPKVVQGYKFNIFYPDLIDKTKAPTYKIEREHGRKRGQSFAAAGEDDTCLIRFIAGAPYEDIAFRIVDKEWDYSAKRERGFRSSFDKGILQLHFQFKKCLRSPTLRILWAKRRTQTRGVVNDEFLTKTCETLPSPAFLHISTKHDTLVSQSFADKYPQIAHEYHVPVSCKLEHNGLTAAVIAAVFHCVRYFTPRHVLYTVCSQSNTRSVHQAVLIIVTRQLHISDRMGAHGQCVRYHWSRDNVRQWYWLGTRSFVLRPLACRGPSGQRLPV